MKYRIVKKPNGFGEIFYVPEYYSGVYWRNIRTSNGAVLMESWCETKEGAMEVIKKYGHHIVDIWCGGTIVYEE